MSYSVSRHTHTKIATLTPFKVQNPVRSTIVQTVSTVTIHTNILSNEPKPENHNPDGMPDLEPCFRPTRKRDVSMCKMCTTLRGFIQRCGRCHKANYCSGKCQKADWPTHTEICRPAMPPLSAMESTIHQMSFRGGPGAKAFAKIGDGTYLDSMPENDAFAQIIGSYHVHILDKYKLWSHTGDFYAGKGFLPDFQRYLDRAEKNGGVLPKWWSSEKRRACEKMVVDKAQWENLNSGGEKTDIMKHYGSSNPIKLRILAKKVEGSNQKGL